MLASVCRSQWNIQWMVGSPQSLVHPWCKQPPMVTALAPNLLHILARVWTIINITSKVDRAYMFLVWGSELARLLKSDHSRPKGQFEAEKASKETTKNWTDQSHPKPPEAESGQALGEKALDVAKKASKVEAFLPTLPSHGFCLALVRRRMLVAVRPAILRPGWGRVALAAAHVEISVSSTATRWPETVWEISFRWDGRHDVSCPRWIWEKSVVSSIWLLKAPHAGSFGTNCGKPFSGARPETSWNSCVDGDCLFVAVAWSTIIPVRYTETSRFVPARFPQHLFWVVRRTLAFLRTVSSACTSPDRESGWWFMPTSSMASALAPGCLVSTDDIIGCLLLS